MSGELYNYRAIVTGIYDGDSVTCTVFLGFYVKLEDQKFRLRNINTPELRGDEREKGLVARDALRARLLDKEVVLTTYKDSKGKYGRWLADVYLDGENINEWLVEEGYAEVYE